MELGNIQARTPTYTRGKFMNTIPLSKEVTLLLAAARAYAAKLNHQALAPGHILHEIVMDEVDNSAQAVLRDMRLQTAKLLGGLRHSWKVQSDPKPVEPDAVIDGPYINLALQNAGDKCRQLNHPEITAAHLLLGIVSIPGCAVAQMLDMQEIDAPRVLNVIIRKFDPERV